MSRSEKKSEAKSIRMRPTVKKYIEDYHGDGFNDKLENMVLFLFGVAFS